MSTLTLVFIVALIFSIYQIIFIILNSRRIRRLRRTRYTDVTQRSFGIARHDLMMLVSQNELLPTSATFRFFYCTDTTVMRNPERYDQLSKVLREILSGKMNGHGERSELYHQVLEESKNWSPKVKKMVAKQAHAMGTLLFLHSSIIRLSMLAAKSLLSKIVLSPLAKFLSKGSTEKLWQYSEEIAAKHNPDVETILETKKELEHLAYSN